MHQDGPEPNLTVRSPRRHIHEDRQTRPNRTNGLKGVSLADNGLLLIATVSRDVWTHPNPVA